LDVTYNHTKIATKDCMKYLEIKIASHLKFQRHINSIERKLSISVESMFKLRNVLLQKSLATLHYTLGHPHFTRFNHLQILQNKQGIG